MLFILAGTYVQAEHYAQSNGIKRNEYRYISGPHVLYGRQHIEFIKVGTWYERSDSYNIEVALASMGANEVGSNKMTTLHFTDICIQPCLCGGDHDAVETKTINSRHVYIYCNKCKRRALGKDRNEAVDMWNGSINREREEHYEKR